MYADAPYGQTPGGRDTEKLGRKAPPSRRGSSRLFDGEPAQLVRYKLGVWVILFLVVLFGITYLLKKEYWKDIH